MPRLQAGIIDMDADRPTLFAIGHTTHSLDAFLALLKRYDIAVQADVRSRPYSPRLEHFNREELTFRLETVGIEYVFLGDELGARREEPECYEGEQAVYNRIAVLPRFREGLARLRQVAAHRRTAIMCAEKEPLDCHRTILICRQLRDVFRIIHILSDGTAEAHPDTEWRLVRQMDISRTLFEPDLSDEELIQRAYDKRADQIAYRASREGAIL